MDPVLLGLYVYRLSGKAAEKRKIPVSPAAKGKLCTAFYQLDPGSDRDLCVRAGNKTGVNTRQAFCDCSAAGRDLLSRMTKACRDEEVV